MKKYLYFGLALLVLCLVGIKEKKGEVVSILGAGTAHALDGGEAVGIIVKNGTKMNTLIADNFTRVIENCDPNAPATTTPLQQCEHVYYQGRVVHVFYSVPRNFATKQFYNNVADFPWSGSIDYVKRSDAEAEAALIGYMLQSGNGTYSIIYEP